jgi:subtilase family serine protease
MVGTAIGTGAAAAVLALAPAAYAAGPAAHSTRIGPAPSAQALQLVLPLRADLAGLRRQALAITTPGSPLFGAYAPVEVLARRFGATTATRRRVLAYLRRVGARAVRIDATGLFADATLAAGRAARLFSAPLAQFRTAHGARFVAPASGPRVPAGLRGLVTGVVGLDTSPVVAAARTRLPRALASQASSARPRSGTPGGCGAAVASGAFTPNQYLTAYGYAPLQAAGLTGAGERVGLIEIDGFKSSDIRSFARCFRLPIPALRTFTVGLRRPLKPGGESTLDLEVLDAAAPGLRSIDLFETGSSASDALQALTAPLQVREKPQAISVSFGLCEPALQRAVGRDGIFSSEGALEMASASGITILAATGDQGSADCTGADGEPILLRSVSYPASSWWVTGVGATNFVLTATNQLSEQIVWNDAAAQPGSASGGGVSNLFRRPNYQAGVSSARNRAVPDVAMLGDILPGYAIYCSVVHDCIASRRSSPWVGIGGTSAATPLLAGGVALVDQQLRLQHRHVLGLVNPLLYAIARSLPGAGVFSDITQIGNDVGPDIPGSGRSLGCCTATPGYDEASGLGSVNLFTFAGVALGSEPATVTLGLSLPPHQRPVHARQLLASVSCSGPCLTAAYAFVAIGRARPFEVASKVTRMPAAGVATLSLRFSARQLRLLRSGLRAHRRIAATVRAVLLDPSAYGVLPLARGSIQRRSGSRSLRVVS